MKKYKIRYTHNVNKPFTRQSIVTVNLSTLRFPSQGHISIYTEEGLGVAHGLLRKDRDKSAGEGSLWMITDKMLLDVE